MKKGFFIAAVSSTILLLDYITKLLIVKNVQLSETIDLLPFLRIVHVKNTGAAFGLFSNLSNNVFVAISFVAIILITLYMRKVSNRLELFSLSLILGGAVGNLVDRLRIAKVIDFIDFFVGEYHWPAFNVADSALTVGIILFLIANIRQWKHQGTQICTD